MGSPIITDPELIRQCVEHYSTFDSAQIRCDAELRDLVKDTVTNLVGALESGLIRAAKKDEKDKWIANEWVKQGILLGFRSSDVIDIGYGAMFKDKEAFGPRDLTQILGARVVPGGTSIRGGAYIGEDTIVMPPAYVNVGSYVDDGTMLDSFALVGSCAQVGKNCHISGKIGGVLEPANAAPCILEDEVFMGMNTSIADSTILRERVVLAPGVNLTSGTKVADKHTGKLITSERRGYLEIPRNAVVVPGTRDIGRGYSISTPVIVKYRDEKTDAAVALEEALRT